MRAIETKKLSKHYGTIKAVDQVSFSVDKGEIVGLLGPNGAGKTTLMQLLTGFLQPDEGDALVGGVDVVEDPIAVQRRIGYLPENAPLYGEMLVQEYLVMIANLRGIDAEEQPRRLSDAIYATGLEEYLTRPIGELSKGYRQRVGITQAILHRPELLILDEPTSGLDPTQIVEIRGLIRKLAQDATVVISTHILSEVELTCDRVLIMMRGKLDADAKLADLRASKTAIVAVESGASGVRDTLFAMNGVKEVEALGEEEGFSRYRVVSNTEEDPCPAIHDLVRSKSWRICELRRDQRTLESVFRELAERPPEKTAETRPSS